MSSPIDAGSDPATSTPPARTKLFVVLGEYAVAADATAWTEVLINALALVGVKEKAARQAIARLATEGMVDPRRHGRRVCWNLTQKGRRWLAEGATRAERFGPSADQSIGRWLMLAVSLTDEQRDLRYHLNRRLLSLGWGSIGNGVWLNSGAASESTIESTLRRLGLTEQAVLSRAEFRPPTRIEDLVERAWDLPVVGRRYAAFVDEFSGVAPIDDASAFALRTHMLTRFTHSLWTDPRLPLELLPPDWPGTEAMMLVRHAHEAWRGSARRWWTDAQRAAEVNRSS